MSNLLKYCGHNVSKEYYINDYGNQITLFLKSIYFRAVEIVKKKKFPEDQGLYPGTYIIDITKEILKKINIDDYDNFEDAKITLRSIAIDLAMNLIKNDLDIMGINHDIFTSESAIVRENILSKAINKLKDKGAI